MLINVDISGLEWVVANWFSQDEVGMQEIRVGVDQHADNQQRFGLPERIVAKRFVFRLIYGGSAWAYCFDPQFNWISKDPKYWQAVIDKFYDKYSGIKKRHAAWLDEVMNTNQLVMPTGRIYEYQRYLKNGEYKWPKTTIVNYPVNWAA